MRLRAIAEGQRLGRATVLIGLCAVSWQYGTVGERCRADEPGGQTRVTSELDKPLSSQQLEFFESRIRPVLVDSCYACHNSHDSAAGDLALDHRQGVLQGGASGAIVVVGQPERSRLLKILRHEIDGLEMPQEAPQLSRQAIADFEQWIKMGLPDPRDKPPTEKEFADLTSWESVFARRKQWWSFRPIQTPAVPEVAENAWSDHPIDRFILKRLRAEGLEPSQPADPETLVRRLYLTLIGLPPDVDELQHWTARLASQQSSGRPAGDSTGSRGPIDQPVWRELVDELLQRPEFGERWARHWMDWIRYAESHGSEGDPVIDNAWQYRDYLIRALNADTSFDQLLREHVAGDLLAKPRWNTELGINESAIGPAHLRMVFHGFAPTDALDERVRFTDDQVNVFSKAFLGLTVSCARCHDHKFDPISQRDYYALFGVLGAARPARKVIDTPERLHRNRNRLAELKQSIRSGLAQEWDAAAGRMSARLQNVKPAKGETNQARSVAQLWLSIKQAVDDGQSFQEVWKTRVAEWEADRQRRSEFASQAYPHRWNLAQQKDFSQWYSVGDGLAAAPNAAGEFHILPAGDEVVGGIYPSGVYSHSLSSKHPGRLTSPDIRLDGKYEIWVRVIGDGKSRFRYVVQNYPRNGTVYPVTALASNWRWQRYDVGYWEGDTVHLELATAKDIPLLVQNVDRSWFGIREAVVVEQGQPGPPQQTLEHLDPLFTAAASRPPESLAELADCYARAIRNCLKPWTEESLKDPQAAFLDSCLQVGLLPNRRDELSSLNALVSDYRKLENEIPIPRRVPGLDEIEPADQRLFERGNHKNPGETVPRRFLELVDASPYESAGSGRLELADDLVRDDNPLTRRVIVNRIWHHLFGHGLVRTPDNFGHLGQLPSHPELLDWLAVRFQEDGWSIKQSIRWIVTSRAWQQSSSPSARARSVDPANRWLSHANLRRLEAEAIRDSLLALSGQLDPARYGSPVKGTAPRRSIYVQVRRNSLDPFLRVFDFPEPSSATGRRDVTNVPAQALTMMNDPSVFRFAEACAERLLADEGLKDDSQKIQRLFQLAYSRKALPEEIEAGAAYLDAAARSHQQLVQSAARLRETQLSIEAARREILDPVRERLIQAAQASGQSSAQNSLQPIARWEFDGDLQDAIGTAHGIPHGGAKVVEGVLHVDGADDYVTTAPIEHDLTAKTLEAWVQLGNLNQRGGGVISIQTRNGVLFDAIVYGERDPRQWMAGSNGFTRTQGFSGPQESEAADRPVHVAITYEPDGRIVGYRDGKPYGKPYRSGGIQPFQAGQTIVSFGLRHLPAGGNRMLNARIVRAQLYDKALSADEIAASARQAPFFVSERQVIAELNAEQQSELGRLAQQAQQVKQQLADLGSVPQTWDVKTQWIDFVRAVLSSKEFIYVR